MVVVVRSGLWACMPGQASEARMAESTPMQAQTQMHCTADDATRLAQARQRTRAALAAGC